MSNLMTMSPRKRRFHDPVPPPPPSWSPDYYVSLTGSSSNPGTQALPWDLGKLASGGGGLVLPGKKIEIAGGTYGAPTDITFAFSGTAANRIDIRAKKGDRVKINGGVSVNGDYIDFWDIEGFWDDGVNNRLSTIGGAHPPDLPRSGKVFRKNGKFIRTVFCRFHDYDDGTSSDASGEGCEWINDFSFNNGNDASNGSGGQALYLQNARTSAPKKVRDTVLFNGYGFGLQFYTQNAAIVGLAVNGLVSFGAGEAATLNGAKKNLLAYAPADLDSIDNLTIDDSDFYHIDEDENIQIGYLGIQYNGTNMAVRDCRINGDILLTEMSHYEILRNGFLNRGIGGSQWAFRLWMKQPTSQAYSAHTVESNTYTQSCRWYDMRSTGVAVGLNTIAQQRAETGYDLLGTQDSAPPSGSIVRVRWSTMDPTRGIVVCWNLPAADSLNVDLSGGLVPGNTFAVRHVYNYVQDPFGTPDVSGTYTGAAVAFPQAGFVPPKPLGDTHQPRSTSPYFNVFVIEKTG